MEFWTHWKQFRQVRVSPRPHSRVEAAPGQGSVVWLGEWLAPPPSQDLGLKMMFSKNVWVCSLLGLLLAGPARSPEVGGETALGSIRDGQVVAEAWLKSAELWT